MKPRIYKAITASNTARQTNLTGVVCSVAGTLIFQTEEMLRQGLAAVTLNVVVGQEVWGDIVIITASSTATVVGIEV